MNVKIKEQKTDRQKEVNKLIEKSDVKELLHRKDQMEKEIARLDELRTIEEQVTL